MSKELEIFDFGGKPVVDSRVVAEWTEKQHKHLLRDIRGYIRTMKEVGVDHKAFFEESKYVDKKGEERACYLITRKGVEFISYKMTGRKGAIFTALYINRFHEYEGQICLSRYQDSYTIAARLRELGSGLRSTRAR